MLDLPMRTVMHQPCLRNTYCKEKTNHININMTQRFDKLTVGDVKKILEGLPNDTPIGFNIRIAMTSISFKPFTTVTTDNGCVELGF